MFPKFLFESKCCSGGAQTRSPTSKNKKTYNSRYSLIVTDQSTTQPLLSLSMRADGVPRLFILITDVLPCGPTPVGRFPRRSTGGARSLLLSLRTAASPVHAPLSIAAHVHLIPLPLPSAPIVSFDHVSWSLNLAIILRCCQYFFPLSHQAEGKGHEWLTLDKCWQTPPAPTQLQSQQRRAMKGKLLKSGGILSVANARKMVEQRAFDEIMEAQRQVDAAISTRR